MLLLKSSLVVRVLDTGNTAFDTVVNIGPCELVFAIVCSKNNSTNCMFRAFDGFDSEGRKVVQAENGDTVPYMFPEPIPCSQGLFIENNADVACWTVGYRPLSCARSQESDAL